MSTVPVSKLIRQHNRAIALSTYRELLRATRIAFNGDTHMLTESRKWARKNFDDHKHAESGSVMAEQAVEHAAATAMILRKNVVQGESSEGAPQHYKLNIHKETERGDDSEFKKYKSSGKSFADMKSK